MGKEKRGREEETGASARAAEKKKQAVQRGTPSLMQRGRESLAMRFGLATPKAAEDSESDGIVRFRRRTRQQMMGSLQRSGRSPLL